jgi:predicted GNAT superfamily acetyltransferase
MLPPAAPGSVIGMSDTVPDARAGIEIRPLDTVEQIFAGSRVLSEVWGGDDDGMPANLLRALEHSGNYVVGLYDGERLIGASAGFFGPPASRTLHSHITGVLPGQQGRGLGRALKQHQREWALARGVDHITWTFDPLIARNAHFNLRVLGARVTEYLVDHYGPMDDGLNRGDESDRLMVSWALTSPRAASSRATDPADPVGPADPSDPLDPLDPVGPADPSDPLDPVDVVASVAIPRDIETMRVDAPAEAAAWRGRVRERCAELLADGLVIGGFHDEAGYLFIRP